MELKKTILISVTMLVIVQCTSSDREVQESKNAVQATLTAQSATLKEGDCYEVKMEEWFKAFNKLQDEGYDMHTADLKAWQLAEAEYMLCEQTTLQTTDDQSLKTAQAE